MAFDGSYHRHSHGAQVIDIPTASDWKPYQLINMTHNIFILVIVIGGIAAITNCDEGLCFEQKSKCEQFAQRIILNSVNTNISAMCKRVEL